MSSSQFPIDSTIYASSLPAGNGGDWYPEILPAIWTRLAMLEKQVFGVAQQPPYPVPPVASAEGEPAQQ